MRRPGLSLLLAGGVLVALAIPAIGLKSVTSGIDELPQDIPVITTYNNVRDVFPTEGVTATVVVEADDAHAAPVVAGIDGLVRRVNGSDSKPSCRAPRSSTARTERSRRSRFPLAGMARTQPQ